MPRLPHGMEITPETVRNTRNAVTERIADVPLGFATMKPVDLRRFDFLFLELQENSDNLLPESTETRDALVALGDAMAEPIPADPAQDPDLDPDRDANISAAYTYFGQFVDHDITLEASSAPGSRLTAPDLHPLPLNRIREETTNGRTALLELDSVYGLPAERDRMDRQKMSIGTVSTLENNQNKPSRRPPEAGPPKADENDLPREPRSEFDSAHDRAALIGDPRNDENTIISQLHVAFLHAHNKLLDEARPPNKFRKAKRRLRRHYQHIVLHDFLKQIADPQIVDDTIERNRVYDPADDDEFFMPLEFSVAAFRFGHSMVRAKYDFNLNFNRSGDPNTFAASLGLLFTFTALSGQLGFGQGTDKLPENWIIEWENFFDPQGGEPLSKARRIDTELVEPLEHLRIVTGEEEGDPTNRLPAKLAVRNLLRGYLLRLPTGQAVARALQEKLDGVRDIPVLTPEQITEAAANQEQIDVLEARDGLFLDRTPLWYYILAEAAVLGGGQHLGPVGSTIVAEVLVGLVRRSPESILDPETDWEPNLASQQPGTFTLPDLLRFAGVLN
jgi:hypothetical protein